MEFNNLTDILDTIGKISLQQYKENIKRGAYATGTLFNNVKYRLDITDTSIKLSFIDLPDYYIYVENGRLAGGKFPPLSAIKKWMISKNIPDKNGASFLIARSIAENGIKPKPYLRNIKLQIKENYTDDIRKAIEEDVKNNISNKLKETIKK